MDPPDFKTGAETFFFIYFGLFFVLSCPMMIFISQVGLAIREIAIKTRRDEYVEESYESLLCSKFDGVVCSHLLWSQASQPSSL